MRRIIFLATVILIISTALMACFFGPKDAKDIFKSECTRCHNFKGVGSGIINLDDITERRSDTWIRDQIEDSRRHDPNSGMPRFKDALTDSEIDMVIKFLHSDTVN